MAQLDVHENKGRQRGAIPFVVVVPSAQFDGYRRRVPVPLVSASTLGRIDLPPLKPTLGVNGIAVVAHPPEVVSVALDQLGPRVASLAHEGAQIIAALDEVSSHAWGLAAARLGSWSLRFATSGFEIATGGMIERYAGKI